MAACVWSEQEFSCPVCLETLRDPATLPCGHTYCLQCIQDYWDRGEAKKVFSCPQCRQTFKPRPTLARSTLLVEAMERLKVRIEQERQPHSICSAPLFLPSPPAAEAEAAEARVGGLYPQLHVSFQVCPNHHRKLELFCLEDQEGICNYCWDCRHKEHRVVSPEKERKKRERELAQMQADIYRWIQDKEKNLQLLPQAARAQKSSTHALQRESGQFFAELVHSVELMGTRVNDLLSNHEAAISSRAEDLIHCLEQEVAQLHRRDKELCRLMSMQDHICFLKNVLTLDLPFVDGENARLPTDSEAVLSGVRIALAELTEKVQQTCKASLAQILRIVTTSSLENAEPKTRDELLKFGIEPALDPNTAYQHLCLSERDRKATLCAESQAYPEHPERFVFWRQVLCQNALAGSPYYWEVEWSGQKFTIGVAYRGMGRNGSDNSCRLGHNHQSWGLYWSGTGFSMWHSGREVAIAGPKVRRIGVYLDQRAGTLAFYRVSQNQAKLLHRVQAEFSGPLYPGFRFWSGVGACVTLCKFD